MSTTMNMMKRHTLFAMATAFLMGYAAISHAQMAEVAIETATFGEPVQDASLDSLLGSVLYADSGTQTQQGEVMVLKYIDNTRATATVPVNSLQRVPTGQSRLVVRLMECRKNYQDKAGNDIAWLDIFMANVSGELAEDADPLFSGWVWKLYPSVSTLQHPQFDVRLVGCVADDEKAS